jgi:FkbM family methyltransferase
MAPRSWNYYWPSYAAVMRQFRNGVALAWTHHRRAALDRAVFWDGQEIRTAGHRTGFVDTVVEMWGLEAYTANGFYAPKNGDVIFDVGANIGLFSVWIGRQAPKARVLAFEPFEENCAAMEANLSGWQHSVEVHHVALGGTAGVGAMVDGGERSLDHQLTMKLNDNGPTVSVITLDQAVALAGTDMIDLLKIDIEGAEADVLAAASPSTMRRFRRIALEYHDNIRPGTCAAVQEILARTHRIVSVEGTSYGILHAVLA